MSLNKHRFAVVIGHNSQQPGARAKAPLDKTEYEFNSQVAAKIEELSPDFGLTVKVFRHYYTGPYKHLGLNTGNYTQEIEKTYETVKEWKPDLIAELHFNKANSKIRGSRVFTGPAKDSQNLALLVKEELMSAFERDGQDSGSVIIRSSKHKESQSLCATDSPSVVIEPFCGSNEKDSTYAANLGIHGLAEVYLTAAQCFCQQNTSLKIGPKEKVLLNTATSTIIDGAPQGLYKNKSPIARVSTQESHSNSLNDSLLCSQAAGRINKAKDSNRTSLIELNTPPIDRLTPTMLLKVFAPKYLEQVKIINEAMSQTYDKTIELSKEDVWLSLFTELALHSNGKINTQFKHPSGLTGPIALPSNLRFWIGSDSLAFKTITTPETDIEQFLIYLGHLKNKSLTTLNGFQIYRGLFTCPLIKKNNLHQAIALNLVLKGYFCSKSYKPIQTPPFKHILQGIAEGKSIADFMSKTDLIAEKIQRLDKQHQMIREAISLV
ncbi:MAG: N-acetylmuramoyl-L-alanine amidase [Verrucomicrobiota bacterium]